jgi:uncharacterized membrane protein YesL
MNRIGEGLNEICTLILKLVYIQLLWIGFTLAGLVVFGAGPATYAMFSVMRQWVRGNKDIPVFKSFYRAFTTGFKESLGFGLFYLAGGVILYVDLLYVQSPVLRGTLLVVSFLYTISLFYIFPILVHYEWKSAFLKIKCSLLFGLSYLQYTLILFVALGAVYFVLLMYPGVMTFFGLSVGSYMTMWMANQVFKRIELYAGVAQQPIEGGGEV